MTVSTAAGLYYSCSSYDGRSVMVSSTACMARDINNIPSAIGGLLLAVIATAATVVTVVMASVAVAAARVDGLRVRVLRRIVTHG